MESCVREAEGEGEAEGEEEETEGEEEGKGDDAISTIPALCLSFLQCSPSQDAML